MYAGTGTGATAGAAAAAAGHAAYCGFWRWKGTGK